MLGISYFYVHKKNRFLFEYMSRKNSFSKNMNNVLGETVPIIDFDTD